MQNNDTMFRQQLLNLLEDVKQYYNFEGDINRIFKEVPTIENEKELDYIKRVLELLGFQIKKKNVSHYKIKESNFPYIYIDDSNEINFVQTEYNVTADDNGDRTISGFILIIEDSPKTRYDFTRHMKHGHYLDWFWKPITTFKRDYIEICMVSIFINLFVLAIPLYSLNVYDRVIINFSESTLIVLTIGTAMALMFDFSFKITRTYILERVAERLSNNFDYLFMERLLRNKKKEQLSIGEQANMFKELQSIREFYASRLVPTLIDIPFILLFLIVIYSLNSIVALIPFFIALLIIGLNFLCHIPISKTTEDFFLSTQRKSGYLIETLSGMETLKLFNAYSARLHQWTNVTSNSSYVTRRNNFILSSMSNFAYMLSQFSHIFVIFIGVYQIQAGNLTIGGLITCTILSSRVIGPILNLSSLLARLKQSKDFLTAIDHSFRDGELLQEELTKSSKEPYQGKLLLEDVTYHYNDNSEKPALKNVETTIQPSEKIGIIGKTAAGKSTLVKIMAGIISPSTGTIYIDDYKFPSIPKHELAQTIAYAPQENFYFRGSVLSNVILGRHYLTEENIKTALEVSGLSLALKQNGCGVDMEVGENGSCLSGGQKQALSLARALASNPKILIFDEPSTGMDSALEKHVQTHLQDFIQNKTFIMVTHRTSMLSLVDRLLLLDDGQIVADGNKNDILQRLSNS